LNRVEAKDRDAWHRLLKNRKNWSHHTLTELAMYWTDGSRSILDIADLIEMETGLRDVELLLTYYHLLAKLEFVEFV
jgi:hypothetical protein